MADGDGGNQSLPSGDAEAIPHCCFVVEEPEQAGAQPGVDTEQQKVLGHGASVDPPIRHGPISRAEPSAFLVRLGVPLDIGLRSSADHDERRRVEKLLPT